MIVPPHFQKVGKSRVRSHYMIHSLALKETVLKGDGGFRRAILFRTLQTTLLQNDTENILIPADITSDH